MTRALVRAHWIGPPSPTGLWIGALLRAFAMLVSCAASIVRMRFNRLSHECQVNVTPETLPRQESGIITRKSQKAAASSQTAAQRQGICAPPAPLTIGPQRRLLNRNRDWDSNWTPDRTTTILDTSSDDDDDSGLPLVATTTILAFRPGET
jgi:hypothetical protein